MSSLIIAIFCLVLTKQCFSEIVDDGQQVFGNKGNIKLLANTEAKPVEHNAKASEGDNGSAVVKKPQADAVELSKQPTKTKENEQLLAQLLQNKDISNLLLKKDGMKGITNLLLKGNDIKDMLEGKTPQPGQAKDSMELKAMEAVMEGLSFVEKSGIKPLLDKAPKSIEIRKPPHSPESSKTEEIVENPLNENDNNMLDPNAIIKSIGLDNFQSLFTQLMQVTDGNSVQDLLGNIMAMVEDQGDPLKLGDAINSVISGIKDSQPGDSQSFDQEIIQTEVVTTSSMFILKTSGLTTQYWIFIVIIILLLTFLFCLMIRRRRLRSLLNYHLVPR